MDNNRSKVVNDEDTLKQIFSDVKYHWLDYIEPLRKKILVYTLILKSISKTLNKTETEMLPPVYNILYNEDVYFKDASFKGAKKGIWGYKIAILKKNGILQIKL